MKFFNNVFLLFLSRLWWCAGPCFDGSWGGLDSSGNWYVYVVRKFIITFIPLGRSGSTFLLPMDNDLMPTPSKIGFLFHHSISLYM